MQINFKVIGFIAVVILIITLIVLSVSSILPKIEVHDEKFSTISSLNNWNAGHVKLMKQLYGEDYYDNMPSFYEW